MRRLSLSLSLAALVAALPVAAQSNAERILNDRYSRPRDYDLVHQRIELSRFDWDTRSFDGRVSVTLRALRPGFDSVVLDAGALLEIRSVAGLSGPPGRAAGSPSRRAAPLRFGRMRDTLVVHLARPAAFGDTVRFTVHYRGVVENGQGLTFIPEDTLPPARPRQLWSQGQDDNNHKWFPTYDFPNDRATWEMIVTVPRGFMAVSNGRLLSDRTGADGLRTLHWSQDQPAVTYLASLIVAPLVRVRDRWRGIPVDYYVYPADSALARPLFGVTPDMMEVFSRLTGVPYPWPKYAQTTVADFFGGMENVSASTMIDWMPGPRAYADRPWYQHILIPHELAHQWFGDYVTTANWANFWLNEGFAEFLPGQYWRVKQGRHAGDDYYLDEYRQYLEIDGRRRMPLAALGSNNIYPKGALVIEMLRRHLGEERFWAGVQRFLRTHALGTATSDDLRQAFLQASGASLDQFFDQWVYAAGHPDFAVSATWDSSLSLVTLTARQTQRDTLSADSTGLRYTVPEVFRMPLTIRIGTADGDVVTTVDLERREQVIHVAGVRSAPRMVIFDDGNTILKTLSFPQPTAWLAEQLTRDPDLWNRAWVIEQLASRAAEPAAGTALRRAATEADYFLTRAQAVAALAGVPGPEAEASLLRALSDTSAQVRAAALEVLGGRRAGGADAARARWERDPSDEVRAAALRALVQLDPGGARALLAGALDQPSYQDAISNAAAFGAFMLRDSSLIPAVARVAERTTGGAYALAAFGRSGSTDALDHLGRMALAPRATLRRRALEAFRYGVPAPLAGPRLRALVAEAPNDEVRAELAATLATLGQ
ncbi:MAG: HEAT repeat domain-containing protein [Gemmatimonadetes bacterium]|nr:HEAT repeat domain-containing protein [Gemmatimonadota bacterium]